RCPVSLRPADRWAMVIMSTQRTMPGGRAVRSELPKGIAGRALCRWCSVEVPRGRRTFCSDWCVHEWRLRSDPGYLRQQVFARDRARCALCRIDATEAFRRLKSSRGASRKTMLEYWGLKSITRKSLWDADHILPVCEGGGECDLKNIRTLCLACHRDVTWQLRRRLRTGTMLAC
ncbi:MAG: HNH endonuclease signature motif containing protein, partial [Acidobacteriaceae bacterium]